MTICSFNLEFTFVLAGWEGTTHNVRVFQHALKKGNLIFHNIFKVCITIKVAIYMIGFEKWARRPTR